MGSANRIGEARKCLVGKKSRRERVVEESRRPERAIGDLAEAPGCELFACRVDRHEADRVQARTGLGPLVPLDLEPRGAETGPLEPSVEEETRARLELLGEVGLVEPDRRHT
jgi:hypothetical protein